MGSIGLFSAYLGCTWRVAMIDADDGAAADGAGRLPEQAWREGGKQFGFLLQHHARGERAGEHSQPPWDGGAASISVSSTKTFW